MPAAVDIHVSAQASMDEIRRWWASMVKALLAAVDRLWDRLMSGLQDEWNVGIFILAMGAVVIITGIAMFRRRA